MWMYVSTSDKKVRNAPVHSDSENSPASRGVFFVPDLLYK